MCVAFSVSVVFDLLVACLDCGVFVWLVVWVCGYRGSVLLIAVGGLDVFGGFWWIWYLVVWVCCSFVVYLTCLVAWRACLQGFVV